MKEETKNPILQTILLVEDRIAEIQESGDLITKDYLIPPNEEGFPTEKYITASTKLRFLKSLLSYLVIFHSGIYPKD